MEAEQSSSRRRRTPYQDHYQKPPSSISADIKGVVPVGPIVPSLNTADSSYDSVTQGSASNGMPSCQVGSPPVQCMDCRKIFSSQLVLDNHSCIKKATSHKCNLCSKTFTRRYNMKIHVQKHFGHFPHRCIICGNGFAKGSALSKHMLKHGVKRSAKLRPQCDICFRVFTRKYTLRLHRAKHMENGQWKCPFCSASFWNSTNLKAHLNMHASEGVPQTQPIAATYMGDEAKMMSSQENSIHSVVHNEDREVASSSDIEQPVSLTFQPPSEAEDCKDEVDFIEMEDLTSNPCSDFSSMAFETVQDSKLLEVARGGNFPGGIDGVHQIKEEPDSFDASVENQKEAVSNVIKKLNNNEGTARGASTSQGEDGCLNRTDYNKSGMLVGETSSDIRGSHQEESSTARTSTLRTELQVPEAKPFSAQHVKVLEPEIAKNIHKPRNNGHPASEVISSALEVESCTQSLSSQTQTYSKETLIATPSHCVGPSQSDTPTTTAPSMSPVLRAESGHSNRSSLSSEVARPSWRCDHCRITFEDSLLYVIHMGCHSHSNPFACNMCGHVSADRVAFMLHFVQGQH